MTLDIAKLKAAAERAKAAAADYQSGVIDAGVFYRRAAEFHRLTDSPEQTLELIAALEAKDADCRENAARIAELEAQRKMAFSACNRWADKFREAERRIAELEARKLIFIEPERQECEGYHIDEAYLTPAKDGECYYRDDVLEALEKCCQAAGINLETRGE